MNIDLLIPEPNQQPSAPVPEPTLLAVPTAAPGPSPTEDAVWDAGSDEFHVRIGVVVVFSGVDGGDGVRAREGQQMTHSRHAGTLQR